MTLCTHHIDNRYAVWSPVTKAYVTEPLLRILAHHDINVGLSFAERTAAVLAAKLNGCSCKTPCAVVEPFPEAMV